MGISKQMMKVHPIFYLDMKWTLIVTNQCAKNWLCGFLWYFAGFCWCFVVTGKQQKSARCKLTKIFWLKLLKNYPHSIKYIAHNEYKLKIKKVKLINWRHIMISDMDPVIFCCKILQSLLEMVSFLENVTCASQLKKIQVWHIAHNEY